jgi:hypothetical protein
MSNDEEKTVSIPDLPGSNPIPPSPASPAPNLLNDLTQVWGSAVGIDALAAKAIILTVVGGVAGNSVRISAPKIGEFGADLQIAVAREKAPALRRGMQRLLESFEASICAMLKPYEHLSSKRAQRQELALLESELNVIFNELQVVQGMADDENTMMKLTISREVEALMRKKANAEGIKARLVAKANAIRFRMRPMVMVQELGFGEIGESSDYAYDNAVLEVAASPGYFSRLAMMRECHLERLAAFRRNSGWSSRLEFVNGEYRRRSSISTLLLTSEDELIEAWSDKLLNATGILDEMLVCFPAKPSAPDSSVADPGQSWAQAIHRIFSNRITSDVTKFTFSAAAEKRLETVRRELLKMGENHQGCLATLWLEIGPALVARLSLCARLLRDAETTVVEIEDLEVAIPLAMHLLECTAVHRGNVEAELSECSATKPRSVMGRQEPDNPVARMVNKLRRLGPCTMRTLFRNYPSARYDVLQPVLDRAIELGLVVEEGKLLKVAGVNLEAVGVGASI